MVRGMPTPTSTIRAWLPRCRQCPAVTLAGLTPLGGHLVVVEVEVEDAVGDASLVAAADR